ncbi:STAP1 protein, partial [Polypterus senegalus]|nr:STAP1 protein [Polypterus senegalus]
MSAQAPAPRVRSKRRAQITALPLYFSGFTMKRRKGEKDYQQYYAELRGNVIFLYEDEKKSEYSEKLELQHLDSVSLVRMDVNTEEMTLTFPQEEVQLKVSRASHRALIPLGLTMGCFQVSISMSGSSYTVLSFSEHERELCAQADPEPNSGSSIKHYKVNIEHNGFTIELGTPVFTKTLNEVIDYFIKQTDGRLKPYIESDDYEVAINLLDDPHKTRPTMPPRSTSQQQLTPKDTLMTRGRSQSCAENTYVNDNGKPSAPRFGMQHFISFRGV